MPTSESQFFEWGWYFPANNSGKVKDNRIWNIFLHNRESENHVKINASVVKLKFLSASTIIERVKWGTLVELNFHMK